MKYPIENYQKYKWFFTQSKKLVIGGKSAEQNDELLKFLKNKSEDYIVMHTHAPGSPFSVILAPIEEIKKEDLDETAVFTASFSRAWKLNKKKAVIDIFKLSSLNKTKMMKTGTWGVKEKLSSKIVSLELVLAKQNNILRAVPEQSAKTFFLKILPGKIDKTKIIPEIQKHIPKSTAEEILQALPTGGIQISK
ncbi:DUF814 domain-containing protein [Candidatus Pacearchaeota archaeon]|nr:DUF814 domain-containing protein [Candidatus Pacearchaeota archaeon]